jgi:spore germination protein
MKKLFFAAIFGVSLITEASAATFEKVIWIPYWRKTEGASTTLANLDKLTQISPFAFELQQDGSIKDALKYGEEPWTTLIAEAKKKKIKIYPSILSYPHNETEKYNFYLLMAQRKKRQAHVKEIVALVKKYNVDGIDIDYEAKTAETRPYFSAFLNELSTELHKNKKQLICTVEARTPPDSRYATTSKEILARVEYANDYKAIGKACDQVRIMAYDQSTDDAKLVIQNKQSGGLYTPVADIEWVKKVIVVAMWDIPAKKLVIGVPTYGSKYEIITTGTTTRTRRIGSMNYNYADELAKSIGVTPTRNVAGEVSFTYSTSTDSEGKPLGSTKQYLVWYSDAKAIEDKVKLAKLYKLGGVAVFKVDGGNDPRLWDVLK